MPSILETSFWDIPLLISSSAIAALMLGRISHTIDLIERENYEQLTKVIDESLTDYEKSVFKLFILDKSYREIAGALGRDVKSVDNAVCRIKKKLKQRI